MSERRSWSPGIGGRSTNAPAWESSRADPVKVGQWLEGADEFQCGWMVRYLWNRVSKDPLDHYVGYKTPGQLAGLVDWMLCGEGLTYDGRGFPPPLGGLRLHGAEHFAKARNAWNQRLNRQRKAELNANTITVDPGTKRKIAKLASEHDLKEDEFLAILIDLMSERRGAVEGIVRQRKKAKRAAIASDLGLFSSPGSKGEGSSL